MSKSYWGKQKQTPPAYSTLEKTACITATVLLLLARSIYTSERMHLLQLGSKMLGISFSTKGPVSKATKNTLLYKIKQNSSSLLTGPHEENSTFSCHLLFNPFFCKILTWYWSTLGIVGFVFEVAIRHQNKVEPHVSTSCTLCDY